MTAYATPVTWVIACRLLLTLVLGCAVFACKEQTPPKPIDDAGDAAVDKEELCAGGGARFDRATNECVCPEGKSWTGNQCKNDADAREREDDADDEDEDKEK